MQQSSIEPKLIYAPGFDFKRESETEASGYLDDVVVQLDDGSQFAVCFIDCDRLDKELAAAQERHRPFIAKPGLIVVSRVNPWIMMLAIRWIHRQQFFTFLKPIFQHEEVSGEPEVVLPEGWDFYKEQEADRRGYLEGVTVQFGSSIRIPVCFMIPLRLRQEIVADALNGRPFFAEPGLIVLPEIKRDVVSVAVHKLAGERFFNHLKSTPIAC
jgi:hypothetical protein